MGHGWLQTNGLLPRWLARSPTTDYRLLAGKSERKSPVLVSSDSSEESCDGNDLQIVATTHLQVSSCKSLPGVHTKPLQLLEADWLQVSLSIH